MTRMESIRKQYESSPEPRQAMPPRRCGNVKPRNKFWLWFWLLFLATLLTGFFGFKSTILPWCKDKFLNNGNAKVLSISDSSVSYSYMNNNLIV